MISRRNYFSIAIVMFIIFFMFLSVGFMTGVWNDYEVNSYAEDVKALPGKSEAFQTNASETCYASERPRDFLVYIGGERKKEDAEVWASYTKKNIESYLGLEQCEGAKWKAENRAPCMFVIDPDYIRWEDEAEVEALEKYLDAGSDVVFFQMPDVSVIKNSKKIQKLFGIRKVEAEQVTVKGIHMYEDFLLGGEAVYMTSDEEEAKKRQDMELTLPWYRLEAGTEVYMKGIMEEADSEDYPVILWKKNYRGSCLMAVNGNYMEDFGGIGLLSAMTSRMEFYSLYPVVNAQSLIVVNYPVLSQENEEQLMKIYSRNIQGIGRDILWPGIMGVYRRNQLGLSCMIAPQLDYEDAFLPDQEQLHYYLKNLNKENAEAGLSGVYISETPLEEKLAEDETFLQQSLPDYQTASFYAGSMSDEELENVMGLKAMSSVRTVVARDRDDSEIIGYLSNHVTGQKAISDGFTHTYRDDLRLRCVETMLGYSNVVVDATNVFYPEDENDSWEKQAEDLQWNVANYWKKFRSFQGTTVSESDERIRKFLALDYSYEREGKTIHLKQSVKAGPVWFVLRTHDEAVDRMEGGSFTKLESDAFLLEITEPEAVIRLKSTAAAYENQEK